MPSIADKAAWALKHTQNLDNPDFQTGTQEAGQSSLRDLVAFGVVFEDMLLYTDFAQILPLGRRNKVVGIDVARLNAAPREQYIHFIANHRCAQLGPAKAGNPFSWMSEATDLRKKIFFETCVAEYQGGGTLSWD